MLAEPSRVFLETYRDFSHSKEDKQIANDQSRELKKMKTAEEYKTLNFLSDDNSRTTIYSFAL